MVIIDVSGIYEQGHIPGAVNYKLGSDEFDNALEELDKEGKYLIYCHSDSASIPAAEQFTEAGFENVYRLEGNYGAWEEAGYDIETSEEIR